MGFQKSASFIELFQSESLVIGYRYAGILKHIVDQRLVTGQAQHHGIVELEHVVCDARELCAAAHLPKIFADYRKCGADVLRRLFPHLPVFPDSLCEFDLVGLAPGLAPNLHPKDKEAGGKSVQLADHLCLPFSMICNSLPRKIKYLD